MKRSQYIVSVLATVWSLQGFAAGNGTSVIVPINAVNDQGIGEQVGTVQIQETKKGLLFTPQIKGLSEGVHGFHVHDNGSCAPGIKEGKPAAAIAAGEHFDPNHTGQHLGPNGKGHLGDLPALRVKANGTIAPVLAHRIKTINEIRDRALIVHANGDNNSDIPKPLGGGGARLMCGVIR